MTTFDLLSMYRMPTGRRLFAQRRVLHALKAVHVGKDRKPAVAALTTHVEAAIAREERSLEEQALLAKHKKAPATLETQRKADATFDRSTTLLFNALTTEREVSDDAPAITAIIEACFPNGVGGVTQRAYAEEVEEARRIETMLTKAGQVVAFAARHRQKFREAAAALEKALPRKQHDATVTQKTIDANHAEGHALMLETVTHVFACAPSRSAADEAWRSAVLEPILTQQRLVAEQYKGRSGQVSDVHPETGADAAPKS